MGTSSEYISGLKEKIESYGNNELFKNEIPDLTGDNEPYADGYLIIFFRSVIGISIQRMLESYGNIGSNEWNKKGTVSSMVSSIIYYKLGMSNLKTCSTNDINNINQCETSCSGTCNPFETFYGTIEVQQDFWINTDKNGIIAQVLDGEEYFLYSLVENIKYLL